MAHPFFSSFRPLVAAIAVILLTEAAIAWHFRPSLIERSNYLNFAFGRAELLHQLVIYKKLQAFASGTADIIQVGDSSGIHNVLPAVVKSQLGLKRYVNLSCCVITGHEGYYDIASYALDRLEGVSALVLYTNFTDLPFAGADSWLVGGGLVGGTSRIHTALSTSFARFSPPSLLLRHTVTDFVYSLNGALRPLLPHLTSSPETISLLKTIVEHDGWLPERDIRRTGETLRKYWQTACGVDDTLSFGLDQPAGRYYHQTILGQRVFTPRSEYEKFAALAARHGARLAIVFHPSPCGKVRAQDLAVLRKELSLLKERWPNVIVDEDQLFDPWPKSRFSALNHLRTGNEAANSRRLARILSVGLGMTVTSQPAAIEATASSLQAHGNPGFNGNATAIDVFPRSAEGVTPERATLERPDSCPDCIQILESEEPGIHRVWQNVETEPGVTYLYSLDVKPVQRRSVRIESADASGAGHWASTDCSPLAEVAQGLVGSIDGGIDVVEDGWYRCWQTATFKTGRVTLGLTIVNDSAPNIYLYPGNRSAGLLIRNAKFGPATK